MALHIDSNVCYEYASREELFFVWTVKVCLCSETNQMHNISNLSYFGTTFYMFRTVFPSIIKSLRLYIQHQVYVIQVLWLLASGNEMEAVSRMCLTYT